MKKDELVDVGLPCVDFLYWRLEFRGDQKIVEQSVHNIEVLMIEDINIRV